MTTRINNKDNVNKTMATKASTTKTTTTKTITNKTFWKEQKRKYLTKQYFPKVLSFESILGPNLFKLVPLYLTNFRELVQ